MAQGNCRKWLAVLMISIVFGGAGDVLAAGKKPSSPPPEPPPVTDAPVHGEFILRVLTYNIHGLPLIAEDSSRYADIGRILNKRRRDGTAPHVVAIQEAFEDRTQELVDEADFPYGARGKNAKFPRLSSGLLILSEFPIIQVNRMIYENCVSWDCFARKGVLHTQVQLPGVPFPLDLYDTHLNSDPDTDPFTPISETRAVRERQIQELSEFIFKTSKSGSGEPSAVLVPADFNFIGGDTGFALMSSLLGAKDAASICLLPGLCFHDGSAQDAYERSLDHQFYVPTPSSSVILSPVRFETVFDEEVDGRFLSDHFGQEVHYRIAW